MKQKVAFISSETTTSCFYCGDGSNSNLFEVYPPLTELQREQIALALSKIHVFGFQEGIAHNQKQVKNAIGFIE